MFKTAVVLNNIYSQKLIGVSFKKQKIVTEVCPTKI